MSELIIHDRSASESKKENFPVEFIRLDDSNAEKRYVDTYNNPKILETLSDFNFSADNNSVWAEWTVYPRTMHWSLLNAYNFYKENTLKMVIMNSATKCYEGNENSRINAHELDTLFYIFHIMFVKGKQEQYGLEKLKDIISIKVEQVNNTPELEYYLKIVFNDEALRIYDHHERERIEKLKAEDSINKLIKNPLTHVPNNKNWRYMDVLNMCCVFLNYISFWEHTNDYGTENDMLGNILCLQSKTFTQYMLRRMLQKPAPRKYIREILADNGIKIQFPNKTRGLCPLFLRHYLLRSLGETCYLHEVFDPSISENKFIRLYSKRDFKTLINFNIIFTITEEMSSVLGSRASRIEELYILIVRGFHRELSRRFKILAIHKLKDSYHRFYNEQEKTARAESEFKEVIMFNDIYLPKKSVFDNIRETTKKLCEKHLSN